jgi:carbamoyl-phosphate synthase large subunit
MRGKLLHIVGGGYNQVPLVLTAKSLGLKVLVTDINENPPCRAHCDLYERIDTADKHATLKAAREHRIDAVATDQTDVAVPTVAFIAESMGLPGIGYDASLRFTNKFLMREALKKTCPRHIPEYHFLGSVEEALEFCRGLRSAGEFIVKPINSQGSKGVRKLSDSGFESAVRAAFIESKGRGLLIERFLHGFEFSVEAYKEGGTLHPLAITKKYHYNSNDCIDERNTWLADISPELESSLFEVNRRIIEALGLPFGITHAEYKVSDGKPYLMEIAARGGGGSISSKIVPFLTGFEPARALLLKIFDQPHEVRPGDYKNKFAVLKFFDLKPGRVEKLHVNAAALDGLLEYNLDLKPGDVIRPISDSRDRPGYFVAYGTDRARVLAKEKEAEAAVVVEYAR